MMGMKRLKRPRFWLAIAILSCLLLCVFGPLKVLFDPNILVEYLQRYRCCTILLFVLVYTLVTVIGIPGTIMTVVGGVVFGLVWGRFQIVNFTLS